EPERPAIWILQEGNRGSRRSRQRFENRLGPSRTLYSLDLFCSQGGATRAQPINTFSNISICRILPPDPTIGFQRFRDAAQRFQCAAKDIENLNGFLGGPRCEFECFLKSRDGLFKAAG